MKSELLYLKEFESVEHFKQELAKYIESPGGSCLIKSGDIIEIEVEEIGTLSNPVV